MTARANIQRTSKAVEQLQSVCVTTNVVLTDQNWPVLIRPGKYADIINSSLSICGVMTSD